MKLSLTLSVLLAATAEGFVVTPSSNKVSTTTLASTVNWNQDLWSKFKTPITGAKEAPKEEVKIEDLPPLTGLGERYTAVDGSTILGPSFKLSASIAAMAPLIMAINPPAAMTAAAGAAFHAALAMWVGVQGNRVRTVFDDEALEFYNLKGSSATYLHMDGTADHVDPRLEKKQSNWLLKDKPNRWKYETITGYRFYPSLEMPVICILWETETTTIGQQPHFFPALFDAKDFKEEMDKHGVPYQYLKI